MADHSTGYAELPRTAYLDHTLRRSRTAAEQRSHRYVTLEHLLLALMDDPDALALLRAVDADVAVIHSSIADTVNNRMLALVDPAGRPPGFSYKFDALFVGASEDAIGTGRRQVDGALALIAVAKDPESSASAILAANGFDAQAALRLMAGSQPPQSPQTAAPRAAAAPAPLIAAPAPLRSEPLAQPPAAGPSDPAAAAVAQALNAGSSTNVMEDMLASVRNILDAEERKERGLPPAAPFTPAPPPPPRPAQPRMEPKLSSETVPDRQRAPGQQRSQLSYPALEPRANSAPRPAQPMRPDRRPPYEPAQGLSEAPAPSFDLEAPPAPQPAQQKAKKKERRRAGQGENEPPGLAAKILQGLPRKARLGVPAVVQIVLTKEEAAALFARAAHRGQPQPGGEAQPACRAVTIRLSAPEGGLFIEPTVPETQWVSSGSAPGSEAFGTWAWTMLPGETGTCATVLSISAHDVGANGGLSVFQVPDQTVKVRVAGSPWRIVWGLFKTLFLLCIGGALALVALYLLKMMGKVPPWFFLH